MEIDGIVCATRNQPRSFPRQSTMRHNPQVEPCPKSTAAPEGRENQTSEQTYQSWLSKKRQTTNSLKRSRDPGSPKHLPFCDGKKEPKLRSSAGMPSCFSSCSRSLGSPVVPVTVMTPIGWLPAGFQGAHGLKSMPSHPANPTGQPSP